jgi:hypothetical protein
MLEHAPRKSSAFFLVSSAIFALQAVELKAFFWMSGRGGVTRCARLVDHETSRVSKVASTDGLA